MIRADGHLGERSGFLAISVGRAAYRKMPPCCSAKRKAKYSKKEPVEDLELHAQVVWWKLLIIFELFLRRNSNTIQRPRIWSLDWLDSQHFNHLQVMKRLPDYQSWFLKSHLRFLRVKGSSLGTPLSRITIPRFSSKIWRFLTMLLTAHWAISLHFQSRLMMRT